MLRSTLIWLVVVGCSSKGQTASPDLSLPPDLAPAFPSAHSSPPQAKSLTGPVMTAPKVVAITFPGDSLQSSIDDFISKIAAASYWSGATAEYGVGRLTALAPVHSTFTPPSALGDSDIASWLTSQINTAGFPQPDNNTIYAIFYQATTTVSFQGGTSCNEFEGYHNDFKMPNGQYATYAVLPRCPPPVAGVTTLDNLTALSSHELIEAATDPEVTDHPAWVTVDNEHVAFAIVGGGGEIGDLCAAFPNSFYRPAGLPYLVQRVWSNAQAAAGHDPCQPDGASPYFNAAPLLTDEVTVNALGAGLISSKGVHIPVGQSATVELDLFSDGPTSGPWKVSAIDFASAFMGAPRQLSFTFDTTQGLNGDKLQLTIKALRADPSGASVFWIESDLSATSTVWLGLVGN
jgi:hypothetical protein